MNQQPYDTSMKEIFQEDAVSILPQLLPGATLIDVLDIEVLQAATRVDRAYRIEYREEPHIFHLEFQANSDKKMAHRLLAYHAGLWRDHELPVISMVIYLFKSSVVDSPLREISGLGETLTFHFQVLPLWTLDAEHYVQEHIISMYALLPAMENANEDLLLQAIDELAECYKDDETKLARRLLWLSTFLQRAGIIKPEEKKKVEERLNIFEQLLEQNEYVQKQRALGMEKGIAKGREEGKAEGKIEGKIEGIVQALQRAIVTLVSKRFPVLKELAEKRVASIAQADTLDEMVALLAVAPDEATARLILTSQSVAQ